MDTLHADSIPKHESVSLRAHHWVSDDAALPPVGHYKYYIIQCKVMTPVGFYGLRWVLIK